MTQDAAHASDKWLENWLETQRAWLARWQQSMAQPPAAPDLKLWQQLFDPRPPDAMNTLQGFQTLLQSVFTQFSQTLGQPTADAAATIGQLQQAFALGPAREHQVAWQEYAAAASEYQVRQQAVFDAYAKVFAASLEAARAAADQRSAQGQPIQGLRELYEVWIEVGERSFGKLAHEDAFMTAQASSANALSRLKLARNVLLDQWLKSQDLPTRNELNSVHQRLRELSTRVAQLEQTAKSKPRPKARKAGKTAHE